MHLEFFNQPGDLTRDHIMVIQNGKYLPFSEVNEATLRILYLRLLENEQSLQKIKMLKNYGVTTPREQVRQFTQCNFASLNHIDDLDEQGTLNFEFIKCPLRNHGCKFNSDVCIKKY